MKSETSDQVINEKVSLDGNKKHYLLEDITNATKILSRKYNKLKKKYIELHGTVSKDRIVKTLKDAPAYHLSRCNDDTIEAFSKLMDATSLHELEEIISRNRDCFEPDNIDKLTLIESGDVRGVLSHFNSVDVIRILNLTNKMGLQKQYHL